jgi:hypothetical protein
MKTAIKAAATDSNDTRNSQAAVYAYDASGSNPIGYGSGATCSPAGIACFARSAPNGFTMWFREQGHSFDWGSLRWCQMYANPPDGCFDAETVALDEFGHVQLLDHHVNHPDDSDYLDAVVQRVSRTKPRSGWNMHVYGRCDVATLQREYDVPNTSAKYSTCLDIDTTLTLSANPASVTVNGQTTLTATLKVAAEDSYGRLRGNPVSNRTVKLQRRPPGTSTWSAVATMTAGASGTYTYPVRLIVAAEFRAVFSTPSGEGLNGDTSPTLLVPVRTCPNPCPQFVQP